MTLPEKLQELYDRYGYCLNTLHTYEFPGSSGMKKMGRIMESFREGLDATAGEAVICTEDYSHGLNGLPPSDVLKFFTKSGSVVIRPSGTEPKLKAYISVTAKDRDSAETVERAITEDLEKRIEKT